MHKHLTRIVSEDRAALIHVVSSTWIRTPWGWRWGWWCEASMAKISGRIIRAKFWVGEVATFVIVVADAKSLQLREVNVQRTATIVDILAIQRLQR